MTPAQVKPEVAVSPAREGHNPIVLVVVTALATGLAGKLIALGLAAASMAWVMSSFQMTMQDYLESVRSSIVGLFYRDALYTLPPVWVHAVIVVFVAQRLNRLDSMRQSVGIVLGSGTVVFWATCLIYNMFVHPGFLFAEPMWGVLVLYAVAMVGALLGGWALIRAVAFLNRRERDRVNRAKGWY